MAAMGHIEAKLDAYGGRFTVTLFVRVMTAYVEWRNSVLAVISKAEDAIKAEQEEQIAAQRNEQARAEILSEFERLKNTNDRFHSPEQIPLSWIRVLQAAGKFERIDRGEASDRWMWAKNEVVERFCEDVKALRKPVVLLTEKQCADIYRKCMDDHEYFPEELLDTAKNLYGRFTIFSQLAPYAGV